MSAQAAVELEEMLLTQSAEDEAAKKAADEAAADAAGSDKGGAGEEEPSESDKIKAELFANVGLDPETEQPVAAPAVPDPVPGQTDEDVKDLPENLNDDNRKLFIQERIKSRKAREEAAAATPAPAPTQAAAPAASQQAAEPEAITEAQYLAALQAAGRAQSVLDGGFDKDMSEEKADETMNAVRVVLATIDDPVLLARLRGQIISGQSGIKSDISQVLGLLDREMPYVQARAEERGMKAQAATKAMEEARTKMSQALQAAYVTYPEFKAPEKGAAPTKEHEFGLNYMKALNDAEIDRLYQDPATEMPKLYRRMKAEYLLEQHEATAKENAALKRRLDGSKTPLSGGARPASGSRQVIGETSDDIKKQLEKRTGMTLG